jgi:hypothetical protein
MLRYSSRTKEPDHSFRPTRHDGTDEAANSSSRNTTNCPSYGLPEERHLAPSIVRRFEPVIRSAHPGPGQAPTVGAATPCCLARLRHISKLRLDCIHKIDDLVVQHPERLERLREHAELHVKRTNRLKRVRKTLSIATRRLKERCNYLSTLIRRLCHHRCHLAVLLVGFLLCDRLGRWWTLRFGILLDGFGGSRASPNCTAFDHRSPS